MWLQLLTFILAHGALTQAVTLVAQVSSGGVKGTVTFEQASSGNPVMVTFSLTGPNSASVTAWQLRAFRLNYDVDERCSFAQLGERIASTVGGLPNDGNVNGVELAGLNSIEGRSIVLLQTGEVPLACATVERTEDYATAVATFRQGVLGHVFFRQLESSATALTRVTADLYFDGPQSSAGEVEWRVVDGHDCSSVGTAYNPVSITGTCDQMDHNSCAVGDLKGKLGMVRIGSTMGTGRMTSVDLNLSLSGARSVVGKRLQLFASGETAPLACASIRIYALRTGVAMFDNDGVTGSISFSQRSPLDPTMARVNLTNMRSLAGGYHVHSRPVPQHVAKDQQLCSAASVSGHWNPFNVGYDASTSAAAASTEDMYEVGDLSRKYGMLNGKEMISQTYRDFNLPLFGMNSIMGRSIVIHRDQTGGPRWICVNIMDTAARMFALATFTYPVIGHVLLQQPVGDEEAETSVYLELNYGDGSTDVTAGHSWAVHANPVGDDMLSADVGTRCVSAGAIFDPLAASASNYDTQCQSSNPLRCKLGDLKAKHGSISVRRTGGSHFRYFFFDVNLALQGERSVIGKSLVLKGPNDADQRLACANLYKVLPLQAEAKSWGGMSYGSVTFTQQVGILQEPTTIQLQFRSLPTDTPMSFQLDARPVAPSGQRCARMGNAFNPFQVTTSGVTKDAMPVGDLSGKFGMMSEASVTRTVLDTNLDLWGPRSVLGRSLTLVSAGSTMACAALSYKGTSNGMMFKAKAVFTGDVTGQILLTQYLYPDGAMMPTTVVVDLRKANGTQTPRHNWHTHEKQVGDDAMASQGRCGSTAGHYNPFKVNVKNHYTECGDSNPLRCELGDQSNKLGTYDMGSGPMVASDVYLPLAGKFGVIGRSIVVHIENRGAPRLACADIMPADLTFSYHLSIKTPQSLNREDMVKTIAAALKTPPYNLAVERVGGAPEGCTGMRVYFLGMEASQLKETFSRMMAGDHSELGAYQSVTCKAAVTLTSLVVLLTSLFSGRLLSS